jgi:SAM-dependent methyltransferase
MGALPNEQSVLRLAFKPYFFALYVAFRLFFAGLFREAAALAIASVGYWRFLPNAFVLKELPSLNGVRILDISSPKLLSLYLAYHGAEVYATDLDDPKIFSRWKIFADVLSLKNYHVAYEDARQLSFPDNHFDAVYSISVIEHIPGDGDTEAIAECRRVLKPTGKLIVQVPYRRQHQEIYLDYDSKGIPQPQKVWYERHYDKVTLATRLRCDGFAPRASFIMGEWLPIDPWIATPRLPRPLRVAILPLEPYLAAFNYWISQEDTKGRPLGALLLFDKIPAEGN